MEENVARSGRFLPVSHPRRRFRKLLTVAVLAAWDGLLLYMITASLIEPVYGAGFVALVSVYLGNQL